MEGSIIIASLFFLAIGAVIGLLKYVDLKPWNIELLIQRKFPSISLFTNKLLFLLVCSIFFLPLCLCLAFVFQLHSAEVLESKLHAITIWFVFVRIYADLLSQILARYIWLLALKQDYLLMLCLLLFTFWDQFNGSVFTMICFSINIMLINVGLVLGFKEFAVEPEILCEVSISFFSNKLSALTPCIALPIERHIQEMKKIESPPPPAKTESDCPSIPDEHIDEKEQNKKDEAFNEDVPPLQLDLVTYQEPLPQNCPPKPKQPPIFLDPGSHGFSEMSDSRSIHNDNIYKKELEEILSSCRDLTKKDTGYKKQMYIVLSFAVLFVYSGLYTVLAEENERLIGIEKSIYCFINDLNICLWVNSCLRSKPASWKAAIFLMLLCRIFLSFSPSNLYYLHSIPHLIIGVNISISLRNYYFLLDMSSGNVRESYLKKNCWCRLLNRFEFQFIWLILTCLFSASIHILFNHEFPDKNPIYNSLLAISLLLLFLFVIIWDQQYINDGMKLNFKNVFEGIGIWAIGIALGAFINYLEVESLQSIDFFKGYIVVFPYIFLFIIVIRHWLKNDFNFYEAALKPQAEQGNTSSDQLQNELSPENEPNLPQSCWKHFCAILKSYIPTTPDNVKVATCLMIICVSMYICKVLFVYNFIDCITCIAFSCSSGHCLTAMGIIGRVKKLHVMSITNVFLMGFGNVIVIFCLWDLVAFGEINDNTPILFFLVRSYGLIYTVMIFIILLLTHFLDNNFILTSCSIILLVIIFFFLEFWGLIEYFLYDNYYSFIIGNGIIATLGVLILYYVQWKRNNYRIPVILTYITIIILGVILVFAALYSIYFMDNTALAYCITFLQVIIVVGLSGRYIHFLKESSSHKYQYYHEIVSSSFFPIFQYNPENMTMVIGNSISCHIVEVLSILLCWGLTLSSLIHSELLQRGLLIFVMAIYLIKIFYVQHQTLSTRYIPLEVFQNLSSRDVAICLKRSLHTLEGTLSQLMDIPNLDLREIIASTKKLNKFEQLYNIKLILLRELWGFRSFCLRPLEIHIDEIQDEKHIELIKKVQSIKSGVVIPSVLENLELYHIICNALSEMNYQKKQYLAAFLTHIELLSKINSRKSSQPIRRSLQENDKFLEDEKKEINRMMQMGHATFEEMDNIQLDHMAFIDTDFITVAYKGRCEWIRAHKIYPFDFECITFDEGNKGDIIQGALDDCWVIAAITTIAAESKDYIKFVLSEDTPDSNNIGKHYIKLCINGEWKSIEVDDYFPCDPHSKRALCCQPIVDYLAHKKIIWPMLVEKAVAKLYEGYNNLEGGAIDYALMLLTGDPAFRFNFLNEDSQILIADGSLWKKLLSFSEKGFLLGAGTLPKSELPLRDEGIQDSHAYAILDAFEFDGNKLLQLKDPSGFSRWTGDWSTLSSKWTSRMQRFTAARQSRKHQSARVVVLESTLGPPLLRANLLPGNRQNTFYISWEDCLKIFEVIFVSIKFDNTWEKLRIEGQWEYGLAGGSSHHIKTVKDNPQYLLEVEHQIEVFCLLTQLIAPSTKRIPKIGFCIFKYENKMVGENDIIPEMVAIGRYSRERAISLNCTLVQGKYILLLSTYHPGEYGKFSFNIWFPINFGSSSEQSLVMKKLTRQCSKNTSTMLIETL